MIRSSRFGAIAVVPLLLAGAGLTASQGVGAAGGWGTAIKVPGTAGLNKGDAGIDSVSCSAPGDCGAIGTYAPDAHFRSQAFVVSQVRGTWGKALEVPGLAALNKRSFADVGSVSCASPGDCSAGGSYADGSNHQQAFVVNEVKGTWRKALEVPGTAALNRDGASISSVSCSSPGNCSAGGAYLQDFEHGQAFVVSEVHGTWGKAIKVPGIAALNTDGTAGIGSVSCSAAGNCSAGGSYTESGGNQHAFVVSQVHGTWGHAIEVPGTVALAGPGGGAGVNGLSCASAGNCAVIGTYGDSQGLTFPFTSNQVGGVWGAAKPVPGMAAFGQHSAGQSYSISCASPGNCAASGSEGVNNGFDVGGGGQPFVVTETSGTWGNAKLLPGMKKLNTGVDGAASSVSCPSAGNCAVAGYYGIGSPGDKVFNLQVFVANEVSGTWGSAQQIPGTGALNSGTFAGVGAVSCATAGHCSAGGSYTGSSSNGQAFVVSQRATR